MNDRRGARTLYHGKKANANAVNTAAAWPALTARRWKPWTRTAAPAPDEPPVIGRSRSQDPPARHVIDRGARWLSPSSASPTRRVALNDEPTSPTRSIRRVRGGVADRPDIAKIAPPLLLELDDNKPGPRRPTPRTRRSAPPESLPDPTAIHEQWVLSKLLYGNTYVLEERDDRSVVKALYVLDLLSGPLLPRWRLPSSK